MATFDKDHQPLDDDTALAAHIAKALAASPLAGWELETAYQVAKRIFKTRIVGAQHIPDGPCLFIGNHSLFALDGLVIAPMMQREFGRFLRPMGDKFLFSTDSLGDFLLSRGAAMGHPKVCDALMESSQDILVFPGGAHEAVKPKSEMYALQWKERYGFVKMAAKHGYTIMPFGLVGPDEFYSHWIEGSELPDSGLGQLLKHLGILTEDTRSDMLPPIPIGALGSLLPKPQACYVGFGQPVDLSALKGKKLNQKKVRDIRSEVASEIEEQLAELLILREKNREQDGLLRRILTL